MYSTNSPRIYFLDVLKIIGTFIVIYGHLYSQDSATRLYIWAFHMPLFFLISGIFHKDCGKICFIKHFRKLFIPGVCFAFLFVILNFFVNCIRFNTYYAASSLLKNCISTFWGLIYGGRMPNTVCWFLFALFWCKILSDIYMLLGRKYRIIFILVCVLLAIFKPTPHYFFIKEALMSIPFYIIGFEFKDYIKSLSFKWLYIPVAFALAFLCYSLTNINGNVSIRGISFGALPYGVNIICFYINAIIGIIALLAISLIPYPNKPLVTKCSAALLTTVGIQKFFNALYVQYIGFNQGFLITSIATIIIMILCGSSEK